MGDIGEILARKQRESRPDPDAFDRFARRRDRKRRTQRIAAVSVALMIAAAGGWPLYRALTAPSSALQPSTAHHLDLAWSIRTNGAAGPPVVAGGRVYVGSHGGTVQSFDRVTGRREWSFAAGGPVSSIFHQLGLVLVASGDGRLSGLDERTGTARWTRRFSTQPGDAPSVLVSADRAYVAFGDPPAVSAFSVSSGTAIWTRRLSGHPSVGLAAADDHLYVTNQEQGSFQGVLSALDARSGDVLWVKPMGNIGNPSAAGGSVFVRTDATLYAIDGASGHLRWNTNAGVPAVGGSFDPVPDGGAVFTGGFGQGVGMAAYDATTGRMLWHDASLHVDAFYAGVPARFANGILYVGGADGVVDAIEESNGHLLWSVRVGGPAQPAPIADALYVSSFDGSLSAFTVGGRVPGRGPAAPWYYTATVYGLAVIAGVAFLRRRRSWRLGSEARPA